MYAWPYSFDISMSLSTVMTETVGDISGTATGSVQIMSPMNAIFVPTAFYVQLQSTTGSLLGLITISIGTNGPDYDNFVPATILTGLNTANEMVALPMNGLSNVAMSTDPESPINVYVRVRIAAIASTYVLRVTSLGINITEG